MSSAVARAEARRKAILSRGNDRLAKLTTSARGEDAPAYMHDDPPLPNISTGLKNFVGEETNMPTPPFHPSPSPSPSPRLPNGTQSRTPSSTHSPFEAAGLGSGPAPDPSVWSEEQQSQLLQALMGGAPLRPLPGMPQIPPDDPNIPPIDKSFAAMMASFPQQGQPQPGSGKAAADFSPPSPTPLQKAMPFIHLVTMWCLLGYFVLYKEPQVYGELVAGEDVGIVQRWATLGWRSMSGNIGIGGTVLVIQLVPFFWAFTTVQVVLHSLRIFSGFDAIQPPTLLALALPHLPPPIPSIIINGLKYLQMGSLFLDDLAGLIVGIGFIVAFSGWFVA